MAVFPSVATSRCLSIEAGQPDRTTSPFPGTGRTGGASAAGSIRPVDRGLRTRRFVVSLALLVTLIALPLDAALAADPVPIGGKGDWRAYTYDDAGRKACYMASSPIRMEGKYKKRGAPYALVANRPGEKVRGEVNFVAGYTHKKDSEIRVTIGAKVFKLFTVKDRAWPRDPASDAGIVKAMIGGNRMIVVGTSSRGTKTTDSYSLIGFTATKKLIDQACKS